MQHMAITPDEVRHIAAWLGFSSDEEVERFTGELSAIVDYIGT